MDLDNGANWVIKLELGGPASLRARRTLGSTN